MATHIPQRELRNRPGEVLKRVEAGEELTITVRGKPVADLVPTREGGRPEPGYDEFIAAIRGMLDPDDQLLEEIRADDHVPEDPFER